jgi:translation initiation factor 2 alpha subunit (eIF-2alpha)
MIVLETFTAKQSKIAETYKHATAEWFDLVKKKPELFKAMKNYTVYQQLIGQYGKFYMMFEVDSFDDLQKVLSNMRADEDSSKYLEGWSDLVLDGSYTLELLNKIT